MSSAAAGQGELPGLSFVDSCIARVRALYAPYFARRQPVALQAALWDVVLDDADRRFLLRLARLSPDLAERMASELSTVELAKVADAFIRLREWVRLKQSAIARVAPELAR